MFFFVAEPYFLFIDNIELCGPKIAAALRSKEAYMLKCLTVNTSQLLFFLSSFFINTHYCVLVRFLCVIFFFSRDYCV